MATLRTEGLTKTYGERTVVRQADLDVSSGEVLGFAYGDGTPLLFYASRYGLPRACDRAGGATCPLAA